MFTPQVLVDSKLWLWGWCVVGNAFSFLIDTLKMKYQQSKDLGKTNVYESIVKQLTNHIHFLISQIYELISTSFNSLDPRILSKLNYL